MDRINRKRVIFLQGNQGVDINTAKLYRAPIIPLFSTTKKGI